MSDTPDFTKLSGDMYRAWEQGMTSWWDQVLESPAFLGALGDNLAKQTQARRVYEEHVDDTLEKLHLPTRQDVVRLTRIATLLEDRLLSLEDTLFDIQDKIAELEKNGLQARVDAAEALVAVQEGLSGISEKLDGLAGEKPTAKKKTPAKKSTRSRKKKTASDES